MLRNKNKIFNIIKIKFDTSIISQYFQYTKNIIFFFFK